MESKTKTLIMAVIVASVAVLAFLPADDVSADPSVSYVGTQVETDSGDTYSILSVSVDRMTIAVTVTIDGGYVAYGVNLNGATSFPSVPVVNASDYSAAVLSDGTYSYTVADAAGTVVGQSTFTVASSYAITVAEGIQNGTVTPSVTTAKTGDTVTLTVSPSTGYAVDTVSYNGTAITAAEDGSYSFTMPAQAVAVSATFKAVEYKVAVAEGIQNGTVTPDKTSAAAGATVTLTVAPADGYQIASVTYNGTAIAAVENVYSFTMPAQDVTVSATFQQTVTPEPGVEYTVTIDTAIQNGTIAADKTSAEAGATVTLTVTPAEGYQVSSVSYNGTAIAAVSGAYSFTMPAADVTVTATFVEQKSETGISIGDKDYKTVAEAAAAAKAGDEIEISKAVSENITLVEGVSVVVKDTGSYTGTVTYGDSAVVVKSLGAKSAVTIVGGSVEISGDFYGSSEFEVTSGTAVLSGSVKPQAAVVITVDDGAKLEIGNLEADYETTTVQIIVSDTDNIVFSEGAYYKGPAIVDKDSKRITDISYNEGSRIFFNEDGKDVYENIYHITLGAIDITVGVADITVPYTGKEITNSDVRTQTVRVDSYTQPYEPTSAAVPSIVEDYADRHEGAKIQNPGSYDKAVEVFVVGGQGAQGLSRVVYADLTISKIDISAANRDIAVTSDSPKTYTGETVVFNYTFTGLTQGLDLPVDQYTVTYTDAQGQAVEADDLVEAGKYTAKIDATGADYYYGTRTLEVEILKAPTTLSLADKTDGAGWTSEAYANGNVTYTVDPSVYPDDKGAVLNVTLTATLAGATQALQPVTGTIASQTDLDTLLRNSFVGEEFDAGYTLLITLSNVESKNYLKATDATLTITVGEHVKAPIYASFSDVEDSNVQTAQDDEKDTTVVVTSKGTGLSKVDGVYTFVIKVASATSGVTLNSTEGTLGYTVLGPSAQTNAVYDAAAGTITFTFEELPSAIEFTLQAYANSTRYYDSPVYTIDLSGVVSNDIAIYLVQSGYPIAKYTANQLYDLSGDGKSVTGDVAANEKLYLPQTSAAGGHWVLQVPEGSTATTYYAGGALYLIDAADRVTYTLSETMKLNGKDVTSLYGIVFVATGGSDTPVDPTVEQTVEINAVGYTIGNGDAVINAALTDAGYTGDAVADCQDASVFYVVFTASFDGAVTVTLNGEVLGTLKENWTAGVHAVYWAADYAAGSTYKVTIAQATDSAVSDTVSYVFSGNVTPAPSTETSTEVRAALVVDSDGVYLMMVAKDGKAIPDGEITVTYDYTYQRTVAGRTLTGSASASFTQAYTSTGQAYAYILLDFAGQAAEHYSGITGADAVFSAGASGPTATAAGITFALPARA